MKGNPAFVSEEMFKADANGHKFKVGQTCVLHGLQSFPEYNGETVTISAIREDAEKGRCYYIKGRIEEVVNWVYEYRLKTP